MYLFTLDRLRSRKDVREVGLTSFRFIKRLKELPAAVYYLNTFKGNKYITCDVASYRTCLSD
jgi:hypothetical protein